ncbi:hypothetical protein F5X97DRAFT_119594 [Nemania serpens]|nr:hypothetical protein F5X97DRAFT_119594 [Nemania serpens]
MADPTRTRVPYDLLLLVAKFLGEGDLAHLAAVNQDLSKPVSRLAFKLALAPVVFSPGRRSVRYACYYYKGRRVSSYPKPFTYAVENGDVELLSRAFNHLDSSYPQGWSWWQLYGIGVGELLSLAAAHNLESLQYLVGKFPLLRGSSIPTSTLSAEFEDQLPVLDNSIYSSRIGFYVSGMLADMRNEGLVVSALTGGKYDCASFLLGYQPPLFPRGFQVGMHRVCYASATTLQFLIDHGAHVGSEVLYPVAAMDNLPDARVFDILVQRSRGVNSPPAATEGSRMSEVSTPLHTACKYLQPTNVEALLRLGAEPNGFNGNAWIRKSRWIMASYNYSSPNPILALLFSHLWDMVSWNDYQSIGRKFVQCLQLLLRYGGRISVPLQDGNILEVLVLRLWKCICHEVMNRPDFALPACPDHPDDIGEEVQAMLLTLNDVTVSPWDEVCRIVSDADPTWRGIAGQTPGKQLVKVLRHYQERHRDLPGPAQWRGRSPLILPDRFGARSDIY